MDEIHGQRAVDTHIECPRCLAEGIVTASGHATRIICMPGLRPPFRCPATHGGLSQDDLVAAGIDPGVLHEWIEFARGEDAGGRPAGAEVQGDQGQDAGASSDGDASWAESPVTQDPGVDRSVDAVIRRTQGV